MNCAKCNTENLDSAKFCKQCGCNLNKKETGQKEQNFPNKFFSGKNSQIIIAVVIAGLVGISASAMFLKNGTIDLKDFGINFFEEKNESDNEQMDIEMPGESEESDSKDNEINLAIDEDENIDMSDIKDSFSDSSQSETEENFEIETIKKYYSFLSNNNLEEAYQMRSDQAETSYDKFKGWYENAQYAKPSDFSKTNSGSYKFYVDYKDASGAATKFKVEMLVIEDKIKTISSVEVNEGDKKQSEGDDSDWLIYTNAEAEYKISYPKIYAITEYENNLDIVSFNFKDTSNIGYHGGEIYVKTGNSANTSNGLLAKIKEECDKHDLRAEILEDKIVDLSSIKARKIKYTTAIGGYTTSYFFTRGGGENLNFELSLNYEDETRNKIINSFKFFN